MLIPIRRKDVFILSLYTTLWGLWVANPYWDTFSKAGIYEKLKDLAPEWVWGLAVLVIGISMFLSFAINNWYPGISWSARIGTLVWFVIFLFYISTDATSTAWITAFTITLLYALITVNTSVNYSKGYFNNQNLALEE